MEEANPDRATFEAFYAESLPRFLRLARLLTEDRGRAEDLAQETFWRVHRAWPGLRDPGAASAYTRTVMVRLASRRGRRRWNGERPEGAVRLETLGGSAHDPALAAVEDLDELDRVLAMLPASQRAVLVLRYYADLSEADTARVLRCRPGTVKSRTARALDALRTAGIVAHSEVVTDAGAPPDRTGFGTPTATGIASATSSATQGGTDD